MKKLMVAVAAIVACGMSFGAIRAVTPDMYGGNTNAWQLGRHNEKMAVVTNGGSRVVFVGDSITHYWEGAGKAQWNRYFAGEPYKALDLGISADRTEHVLWRITEGGELDGYEAKCVMLMIGTNNTGHRSDKPEAIAAGVKRILEVVAKKQPQAKVLLLPIFPCGSSAQARERANNEAANALIARLADGEKVIWVDFNAKFLDEKGDTAWCMPDRLHPNAEAYKNIWLPAVLPHFQKICGK